MAKVDLSVELYGHKLKSPLVLASGILGTDAQILHRVAKTGIGAVTTKSCGLLPRPGHENPTVLAWEHGLLNAVGLTNPGVDKEVEEIKKLKKLLSNTNTKIIASFFGCTIEEFGKIAKTLSLAKPDFLEANISCPNTMDEFGRPFATNPTQTYKIVKNVKKASKIPLIVKLSPNVTDIVSIAKAAEEGGADAISAINALLGMIIDTTSKKPILTNKMGGISGPAVKPIAVRCIYQIRKAVKIPIIGIGGVTSGKDAIEMILSGASAVGVGSAVYYRGINVFSKINKEIEEYCRLSSIKSIKSLIGGAHE